MHARTTWTVAAVYAMLWSPGAGHDVLMTVPQADGLRSTASPATAAVSADGRYVAVASYAPLVPADTDNLSDIYVLDRVSGQITLESLTADDRPLSGDSTHPRLSADGRYLVFKTTIVTPDSTQPATDIVLRDRAQDRSILVTRSTGGAVGRFSGHPAISADGRLVVFVSSIVDLVDGLDANGTAEDVYAFEASTRMLRRVSVDSLGVQHTDGASFAPSVSGDGRYVAFTSTAELDIESPIQAVRRTPSRPTAHVYVRDMVRRITTRVSVAPDGARLDGHSYDPAISADGRFVAFVSTATNLWRGDRNRSADVFVRDMAQQSTALISRSAHGGTGNGASGSPAISGDGRFVAFQSDASDLVCPGRCPDSLEDVNLLPDVFLFDRAASRMTWISAGAAGWAEESCTPQLAAAGDIVTFTSRHPVDARDVRNDFDLFIRVIPR
jgi:Tol biopolymer transport system component